MRAKLTVVTILALGMVSFAVADAPEMSVSPDSFNFTGNDSLLTNEEQVREVEFTNLDNDSKIVNVSLEDMEGLEWSETGFNISAEDSKVVNATFYLDYPDRLEKDAVIEYDYIDDSGNQDFNKNLYPNFSYIIESEYPETNLSSEFFGSDFELDFNESDEGVYRLENTGNNTAYNVSVSGGEYVEFSDTSVSSLAPGEDKLFDFVVEVPVPDGNATEKSNQTYSGSVEAEAVNADSLSDQFDVFVPFKEYDTGNESIRQLLEQYIRIQNERNKLCQESRYQDSPLCGGQLVEEEVRYVNNTPVYQANLTEDQLQALELASNETQQIQYNRERINLLKNQFHNDILELEQAINRTRSGQTEEIKDDLRSVEEDAEQTNSLLNQTLKYERQRAESSRMNRYLIILGFLAFGLVYAWRDEDISLSSNRGGTW